MGRRLGSPAIAIGFFAFWGGIRAVRRWVWGVGIADAEPRGWPEVARGGPWDSGCGSYTCPPEKSERVVPTRNGVNHCEADQGRYEGQRFVKFCTSALQRQRSKRDVSDEQAQFGAQPSRGERIQLQGSEQQQGGDEQGGINCVARVTNGRAHAGG